MEWLGWIGVLIVGGVVVDRAGVWAERRGWIYWRSRGHGGMAQAVGAPVVEAFNPSHQHVVVEKERQRLEIRQTGRAEPGLRRRRPDLPAE